MISRISTPEQRGALEPAQPARRRRGAHAISSPVSSTNTSSRLAGPPLALGRVAVAAAARATDVPVRRVAQPGGPRLRLDLGEPRRRPVDLDRLAAGVLDDQLVRRAAARRACRAT